MSTLSPRERVAALAAQQKPKKQVPLPAAHRPHLGLTDDAEQAVQAAFERFDRLFRVRPVLVVSNRRIAGGLNQAGEQAACTARARYREATTPPSVPSDSCHPSLRTNLPNPLLTLASRPPAR